jgi:iron(III) transport system ATP-binding protein
LAAYRCAPTPPALPAHRREVIAAIRPEDILVQGVDDRTENLIRTAIEESEYMGSFVRATMTGGDLDQASLRADLSMKLVRRLGLANGVMLPVSLPWERIRLYEPERGG